VVDLQAIGDQAARHHASPISLEEGRALDGFDGPTEVGDRFDVSCLVEDQGQERVIGKIARHRNRDGSDTVDLTALSRLDVSSEQGGEIHPDHHLTARWRVDGPGWCSSIGFGQIGGSSGRGRHRGGAQNLVGVGVPSCEEGVEGISPNAAFGKILFCPIRTRHRRSLGRTMFFAQAESGLFDVSEDPGSPLGGVPSLVAEATLRIDPSREVP
jgi:hypothetical protein